MRESKHSTQLTSQFSMHFVQWKQPDPKASYCTIPFIWHSRKGKTTRVGVGWWLPGIGGEGKSCRQRACKLTLGRWDSMVLWCWPQDTLSHPQNCIPQRANFTEHKERHRLIDTMMVGKSRLGCRWWQVNLCYRQMT